MELNALIVTIGYLGKISIFLSIGLVVCLLAFIGYNTYIKFQDKDKKIEVRTRNSNLNDKD